MPTSKNQNNNVRYRVLLTFGGIETRDLDNIIAVGPFELVHLLLDA